MTGAPAGAGKIALLPFKVGGLHFEPGDRYDPQPSLSPREEQRLVDQMYVSEFSPRTYQLAIQRRPPGTVGKGWSLEYLYTVGALERPPSPQPAETAKVPAEGDESYRGYTLRPRPCGIATRVTVLAANGEKLHPKEFLSIARAREFVDTLPALADSDGSATTGDGSPGDEHDDDDVQRLAG